MIFYHETRDAVVKELESSQIQGLDEMQVQANLVRYGENKLREKKKKTNIQRFLDQFKDVMILILLAAAAISFVIACVEGEPKEFFEPVLILLIVIINAVMGVMQESKAEKALEALKGLSAPHARVIRDGEERIVDAKELVPGDIIRLEAGDFVPADARLLRNQAAMVSVLLVFLVLFTPLRTVFGLIKLSGALYLAGILLILVPLIVMEVSKAIGLIRHRH